MSGINDKAVYHDKTIFRNRTAAGNCGNEAAAAVRTDRGGTER